MENTRNGYIKIGFSKNPVFREATLQAEEPEITLLCKSEGTLQREQELHIRYEEFRVRGEWFDIPKDLLESLVKEIEAK